MSLYSRSSERPRAASHKGPLTEDFALLRLLIRPGTLAVVNIMVGLGVGYFGLAALGGYSLNYIAHPTALSNALEWLSTVGFAAGMIVGVACVVGRARSDVRVWIAIQLLLWWPAQVVVVLWAHALKY